MVVASGRRSGPGSGGSAMSQHVITTAPVGIRRRTIVIAIGLLAVLAIGVGVGVAALASGGSEPAVRRSAPTAVPAPAPVRLCGHDVTNLLAAVVAMPPSVQAQVVGTLSPDLANGLGNLALVRRAQPVPAGARQRDVGRDPDSPRPPRSERDHERTAGRAAARGRRRRAVGSVLRPSCWVLPACS